MLRKFSIHDLLFFYVRTMYTLQSSCFTCPSSCRYGRTTLYSTSASPGRLSRSSLKHVRPVQELYYECLLFSSRQQSASHRSLHQSILRNLCVLVRAPSVCLPLELPEYCFSLQKNVTLLVLVAESRNTVGVCGNFSTQLLSDGEFYFRTERGRCQQ